MFGQTNDLQKAIDQVNNPDNGGNNDNVSAIQDQLGVPPMPPADGAGVPPMPTPFSGSDAGSSDNDNSATDDSEAKEESVSPIAPVEPTPIAPEAPVEAKKAPETPIDTPAPATIEVTEVAAETTEPASAEQILSEDGDIAKIRENVLKDLMPLMDKVQTEPEKKFEIYKDAMETLHDRGLVSDAYKVASQIADENKKAESLIELMQAIDTLK